MLKIYCFFHFVHSTSPQNANKNPPARSVGNIGLSASAESVHQSATGKRPSRRGTASRHHPHRSSSRRNKENGSRPGSFRNNKLANNSNNPDIDGRLRKQRAVSFEQPPPPVVVVSAATTSSAAAASTASWCEYSISIDESDQPMAHSSGATAAAVSSDGDELMDTSPPPKESHFKPPRV